MFANSYFEIIFLEIDTRGKTKFIEKRMFGDLF